ncbi:IS5 family transposase [Acetobacter okinawensis]|uniref:IS5 family transposase n=1 Tax=Acetobacter okinawensis TaxID=1076594 RepID=UPI001BAC0090|nr:IS5 family transposase [Acetobacter okinawensis]MBS0987777.1 IS5 family transposase [Acetobacter okinawensis]
MIEAVRPRARTPPHDLRRTIAAIFWRHENGAKWRSILAELGPWWRAAQLSIRWAKLGVWERRLERVQEQHGAAFGMTFLDGTNIRTHHKAAGAQKRASFEERDHREALGRSRGGYGTKVCVIADGHEKAFGFALAPGQAHELPLAPATLDSLSAIPLWGVADKGYASNAFRERIWDLGARPAIPAKRQDGAVSCLKWVYWCPHFVENLWACLKEWRTVASRYEKTATSFLAVIHIAAAADWAKPLLALEIT